MSTDVSGPLAQPRGAAVPPWLPLLVVAVAWAAQGGVLGNGFVWDDAILIRDDPTTARGLAAIPSLLAAPWGGAGSDVGLYRPLVSISLAVQAALHGTAAAFPFHAINLFLHASVATALLALLLRLLPGRPIVATAASLLFAAHPLHTGTVSFLVARADLLCALLGLLAALVWTRARASSLVDALLAGLLWFGALLSKESAVVLPVVLLVLDAAVRRETLGRTLRTRALAYATLLVPLAAWLVLRTSVVGGLDATTAASALGARGTFERTLVGAGALARALARLVVPIGIGGDASNEPVLDPRAPIPFGYVLSAVGLVVAAIAVSIAAARRRATPLVVALGLVIVLWLPVLQIVPIGGVFEDRLAYLPSLAAIVPLALVAERALLALSRPAARVALAGACLAAAGLASWRVAADWHDETSFDRALLREDPAHLRAIDRLSRELVVLAAADREEASSLPTNAANRTRIGALRRRAGERAHEAVRILERARSLPAGRHSSGVLRGLGDAYLALPARRDADALEAYRASLETRRVRIGARRVPVQSVSDPAAVAAEDRRSLGRLYDSMANAATAVGDAEAAATYHESSSVWDPTVYAYAARAGNRLRSAFGDATRALPFLARATRLAPPSERAAAAAAEADARRAAADVDALFDRGVAALTRPSGEREAQRTFEEILGLRPGYAPAHVALARIHRKKGNFRDALGSLDAAQAALDGDPTLAASPKGRALAADVAALRAKYVKERDE